jgi:tetratricopeptide (TPR) repeat protein/2-polyprenyl-6-methoxyphenol hydroxylase-like FAD-dependent oxidoreductase
MPKTKPGKETIIIVGMGPAGLAAAIEAVRHARESDHLVFITNREVYERKPIYRINRDAHHYLKGLVGEDTIKQQIKAGHYYEVLAHDDVYYEETYFEIRIDRTERLLKAVLDQHAGSYEMIYVQSKSDVRVHADERTLELDGNRQIPFKYLVAADGVHHSLASQLMRQGVDLHYQSGQQRQIHSFHAIGCYHVPGKFMMEYYRSRLLAAKDDQERLANLLVEMKKLGWPLHSFPEVRLFIVENTLYVGSEAPRHGMKTDAEIDRWLRLTLRGTLSDAEVNKLESASVMSQPGQCGTFEVTLEEASKVIVPLRSSEEKASEANTSWFIQLGDALRAPHYQTGSGVVQGLLHAELWGGFLQSGRIAADRVKFSDAVLQLILHNRERIELFLERRRWREEQAKQGVHYRFASTVNFGRELSIDILMRSLRMVERSSLSEKTKIDQMIDYHREISRRYRDQDEYKNAIFHDSAAIELGRAVSDIWLGSYYNDRGAHYYQLGQYHMAFSDFKKAVSLLPNHSLAYNNIAQIYVLLGDDQSALEYTHLAIKHDPDQVSFFGDRAMIYVRLNMLSLAMDDFNSFMRHYDLSDESALPYVIGRGKLHQQLGSHQSAIADFTKAIKLDNTVAVPFYLRAESAFELRQYRKCRDDLEMAFNLGLSGDESRAAEKLLNKVRIAEGNAEQKSLSSPTNDTWLGFFADKVFRSSAVLKRKTVDAPGAEQKEQHEEKAVTVPLQGDAKRLRQRK